MVLNRVFGDDGCSGPALSTAGGDLSIVLKLSLLQEN